MPVPTPRPGWNPNPVGCNRFVVTLTTAGWTSRTTASMEVSPGEGEREADGEGSGDWDGPASRPRSEPAAGPSRVTTQPVASTPSTAAQATTRFISPDDSTPTRSGVLP